MARSIDGVVHALDIEGTLSVYRRPEPGAPWSDAGSFADGARIARYSVTLQDVLTVIATNTGLPVLNGDARQTDSGTARGQRFGRVGMRLRFQATGFGTRSDTPQPEDPPPGHPEAALSIAGSMIIVS